MRKSGPTHRVLHRVILHFDNRAACRPAVHGLQPVLGLNQLFLVSRMWWRVNELATYFIIFKQ